MRLWEVLFISLLPGAGNFGGGLLAESARVSGRSLNWALHGASGIMIAIVAIGLLPRGLDTLSGIWIAAAFTVGGCVCVLVRRIVEGRQAAEGSGSAKMWVIYIAVAVDLTTDGLMIGSASALSFGLALTLAAGQVLADVPRATRQWPTSGKRGSRCADAYCSRCPFSPS